ncbi:MOSC domain-containing protein [Pseudanabaena sp. BC1403]|uniref:MOSC domain-containing protein n=1 Tax=Pseudanabaena sp. BC1403 TaxID=2043171 RepID=UPI000CD84FD9|nr:MOSC N-terminal beta barrel domain-containing protein [Pseudanabaena sp. BC1403]
MAKLSKILIFPIKSLDPIALDAVEISDGGALKGDREFAMFDKNGKYINAKRYSKIHLIRAKYELSNRLVHLQIQEQQEVSTFHLDRDRIALTNWLSKFFEQPVELRQNVSNGFPDDPEAWGATVISEATLSSVQSWYASPQISLEQIRDRFRTNLEIADTEPFWEDHLFAKAGETVPFKIGDVQFFGTNPCQRCPVPTRDTLTGEVYPEFQKIFTRQREASLPANIVRSRFNHFYRLALNTRIPIIEAGKVLKIGDIAL